MGIFIVASLLASSSPRVIQGGGEKDRALRAQKEEKRRKWDFLRENGGRRRKRRAFLSPAGRFGDTQKVICAARPPRKEGDSGFWRESRERGDGMGIRYQKKREGEKEGKDFFSLSAFDLGNGSEDGGLLLLLLYGGPAPGSSPNCCHFPTQGQENFFGRKRNVENE